MEEEFTISQALNLAVKNHTQGNLRQAEIIYRKILEKDPNNSNALHLLGLIAHQVNKPNEAIKNIKKAIELKPNTAIYHHNLGMVYDTIEDEEESTKSFKKALELDSQYENAHLANYNLGISHSDKGELNQALSYYNKAIDLNSFPEAHWNKSLILLLLENFNEGWKEYEYRFKKQKPSDTRIFNKPKWNGTELKNKKILILSEQGFGDNIQFIRYLQLIKEKQGYIILECKKELKPLFKHIPEIDELIEKQENTQNINHDFYTHIMTLPKIFNTNLQTIPNKTPYLKADSKLIQHFKEKIKQTNPNNFKIGIAWAGNPNQDNDKNRSTTFENFKILKNIPKTTLFSLQKGKASEQLNDSEIINLADEINNFADTAAIIQNLDLIISVDTSIAHLAGALNKPVWTLLTFTPDWRWFLNKNYSPWYPSMKLFRQSKPRDWSTILNNVKKELEKIVKSATSSYNTQPNPHL